MAADQAAAPIVCCQRIVALRRSGLAPQVDPRVTSGPGMDRIISRSASATAHPGRSRGLPPDSAGAT